jgi:GAF domain-containing protein
LPLSADLGEQIANTADFQEMLRSSFHLLLWFRGLSAAARWRNTTGSTDTLRVVTSRGLETAPEADFPIDRDRARALATLGSSLTASDAAAEATRLDDGTPKTIRLVLRIQILLPLVVHDRLIGVVLLGEKASGEEFTDEDLATLSALARHIAVGINSHHLLGEVKRKAEENQRLYEGLRKIYKETVHAFAAAIDIKDRYTQGHSVALENTAKSSRAKWAGETMKSKASPSPDTCTTSAS